MKEKVKVFSTRSSLLLEREINDFLDEKDIEIIDVKYSVATSYNSYVNSFNETFTTIIIYKLICSCQ